jgi:hypothetical protein
MSALVLLLMAMAHAFPAQTDAWFLDHPWGTHISRMREKITLQEIARTQDRATYASGIRRLGNVDLDECNLEFVDNRFSGVIILTKGWANAVHLLEYLRQMFGEGSSTDPPTISWIAGTTRISYEVDSYGDAYVYWYSLTHQAQ